MPRGAAAGGPWEPLGQPAPSSSGASSGSREPGLPAIPGAVCWGVTNMDGISSPIGPNSKYAMAARIKASLPKRNQEKQWTLEFSL